MAEFWVLGGIVTESGIVLFSSNVADVSVTGNVLQMQNIHFVHILLVCNM